MRRVSLKSALVIGACAWVSIVQVGARDEEVVARLTRQIDALAAFVPPGAGSRSSPILSLGRWRPRRSAPPSFRNSSTA